MTTHADVNKIVVRRRGRGPEVVLVHGGASPETTWAGLEPLQARWTLVYVYRRGYPPSPPPPGRRQDFEVDAADLGPLLDHRPHLVVHSYGGLGGTLAACARPDRVRSLTLIEPPLYQVAPDDPAVMRLRELGDAFLTQGLEANRAMLTEFLAIAGVDVPESGPLPEALVHGVVRAHHSRLPSEARPALDRLRAAGVPILSVSGGHAAGLERIADGLARVLDAERVVAPGAGHFVAAAPGFAARLERFLLAAERRAYPR